MIWDITTFIIILYSLRPMLLEAIIFGTGFKKVIFSELK